MSDDVATKRGHFRSHGVSRLPLMIMFGQAVICVFLMANYWSLSSTKAQLEEDLYKLHKVYTKKCDELAESVALLEKTSNQLSHAQLMQRDQKARLEAADSQQKIQLDEIESLKTEHQKAFEDIKLERDKANDDLSSLSERYHGLQVSLRAVEDQRDKYLSDFQRLQATVSALNQQRTPPMAAQLPAEARNPNLQRSNSNLQNSGVGNNPPRHLSNGAEQPPRSQMKQNAFAPQKSHEGVPNNNVDPNQPIESKYANIPAPAPIQANMAKPPGDVGDSQAAQGADVVDPAAFASAVDSSRLQNAEAKQKTLDTAMALLAGQDVKIYPPGANEGAGVGALAKFGADVGNRVGRASEAPTFHEVGKDGLPKLRSNDDLLAAPGDSHLANRINPDDPDDAEGAQTKVVPPPSDRLAESVEATGSADRHQGEGNVGDNMVLPAPLKSVPLPGLAENANDNDPSDSHVASKFSLIKDPSENQEIPGDERYAQAGIAAPNPPKKVKDSSMKLVSQTGDNQALHDPQDNAKEKLDSPGANERGGEDSHARNIAGGNNAAEVVDDDKLGEQNDIPVQIQQPSGKKSKRTFIPVEDLENGNGGIRDGEVADEDAPVEDLEGGKRENGIGMEEIANDETGAIQGPQFGDFNAGPDDNPADGVDQVNIPPPRLEAGNGVDDGRINKNINRTENIGDQDDVAPGNEEELDEVQKSGQGTVA